VRAPPPGRATLEDVAARAGVSRATASRVVTGAGRVAAGTRRAVEDAVDALGYAPNQAARSLAASRTDTIALVVSEPSGQLFADPYFGRVVRGVATALTGTRYLLTLLMAHDESERAGVDRHLLRGNADGVLLVSTRGDDPLPGRLADAGVPCVMAGRPAPDVPVSWVDADNEGGARLAVGHLLDRNRRRIAAIAGPQDMAAGVSRLAGYREAIERSGLPVDESLIAYGDFSEASGERAVHELLARNADLDAVFAASDLMAVGALRALRELGRRVPDDVSLVGFDDVAIARQTDPPLTTVHQPVESMGREMVRLLLARIAGAAPTAVVVETHLVERASTCTAV